MDKKKVEEGFLKEALEIIRLKDYEIIPRESPDFILKLKEKTVGIELTEYYQDANQKGGSKLHAIEQYYYETEKYLYEKFKKSGKLKNGWSCLYFLDQDYPRKGEELDTFTDELIRFVDEYIGNENLKEKEEIVLEPMLGKILWIEHLEETETKDGYPLKKIRETETKPFDGYPTLKKYLRMFTFTFYKAPFVFSFGPFGGNVFGGVLTAIQPKIEKATKYKKNDFDELWLLVTSDGSYPQALPVPKFLEDILKNDEDLNNILKKSNYDKIFIYHRAYHMVFEWPGWKKFTKDSDTNGYQVSSDNSKEA